MRELPVLPSHVTARRKSRILQKFSPFADGITPLAQPPAKHMPGRWIAVSGIILVGIGILSAVKSTGQRDHSA
jgi:hypothetical protein